MSKEVIKRIVNKDLKEIQKMNLAELGIHVYFDESNMMKAVAMIIGPEDTPYEDGILYFVIEFPKDYPFSPPKVEYFSYSRYRIHPNLYVGTATNNYLGKVCLSSINTWSGPKWTTVMHIGSVLLSIQSLLCKNPIHNEPGFENEKGERNDLYNLLVEYDTFKNLICVNGFDIPHRFIEFKPMIMDHLKRRKDKINERISLLSKKHNKVIKIIPMLYNISMWVDYPKLNKELIHCMNKI